MDKKFSFDLQWIATENRRNNPTDAGYQCDALLAIAERLEAIYEEMVEAKKDRRA